MAGYEIDHDQVPDRADTGCVSVGDILAAADEQLQDYDALAELYRESCPP